MSFIDGAFFFFFCMYIECRQIIGVPARPSSIINISCPKLIPHGIGAGKHIAKAGHGSSTIIAIIFTIIDGKFSNTIFKYAGIKRLISDQLVFFSSNFSSEQAGYVINISADNPPYWCLKRMERLSRSDTSTSCPPVLIPYKSLSQSTVTLLPFFFSNYIKCKSRPGGVRDHPLF